MLSRNIIAINITLDNPKYTIVPTINPVEESGLKINKAMILNTAINNPANPVPVIHGTT